MVGYPTLDLCDKIQKIVIFNLDIIVLDPVFDMNKNKYVADCDNTKLALESI